jgi:hypothetical protein
MRRRIPGLHAQRQTTDESLEGLFLVRVDRAEYRWHPQKPFLALSFSIREPKILLNKKLSGRIYCTSRALWKLNWFLRDFGYDTDLLGRDEVDEKALAGLTGVVRTSRRVLAGRVFLNLEAFAPTADWDSDVVCRKDVLEGSNDLQLHSD